MTIGDFIIRNPLELKNNTKVTIWAKGKVIYKGLFYKINIDTKINVLDYDKFFGEACLIVSI